MKTRMRLIAMLMCLAVATQAQTPAQKSMIKEAHEEGWKAKAVALTPDKGCVLIGMKNGYRSKGLSENLLGRIKQLKSDDYVIDNICISPKGQWAIIYDKNRKITYSKNIPEELKELVKEAVSEGGYTFSAIAFNDNDEWMLKLYTKDKKALNLSSTKYEQYLKNIKHAWMTNKGAVFLYLDGTVRSFGTVPNSVKKKIDSITYDIHSFSYTDAGDVVITDGEGKFSYSLTK